MLQLDNFFAWISVEGRPSTEYGVEYGDDLTVATCWIASEEGKPFTISWRDSVRSQASMGRTFVDGFKCGVPKGINMKGYKRDLAKENDSAHQRGSPASTGTDRLLVFSKVHLTDDDRYLEIDDSEKLGEIRLEISYVRKGAKTELEITPFLEAEGKVHERKKKMAMHHTKLGSSVEGERKPILRVKATGKVKTFLFKYRPLDVLTAQGIVPRDVQSERLSVDLTMESGDIAIVESPKERTNTDQMSMEDAGVAWADQLIFGNTKERDVLGSKVQIKEDVKNDLKSVVKLERSQVDGMDYKIKLEDDLKKELQPEIGTDIKAEVDTAKDEFLKVEEDTVIDLTKD